MQTKVKARSTKVSSSVVSQRMTQRASAESVQSLYLAPRSEASCAAQRHSAEAYCRVSGRNGGRRVDLCTNRGVDHAVSGVVAFKSGAISGETEGFGPQSRVARRHVAAARDGHVGFLHLATRRCS